MISSLLKFEVLLHTEVKLAHLTATETITVVIPIKLL